jgi:hypothetical protein
MANHNQRKKFSTDDKDMLTLAATNTLQGVAGTATTITYTIFGMEFSGGVETYKVLAQGQLGTSVSALYTVPSSTTTFVKTIILTNTTSDLVGGITLLVNGTAAGNQIVNSISITGNGTAILDDSGLKLNDGQGCLRVVNTGATSQSVFMNGIGTSLVASTEQWSGLSGASVVSGLGTPMALGGVLKILRVRAAENDATGPNTTVTVAVNGVDTGITVTIAPTFSGIASDVVHTATVQAGDMISLHQTADGTGSGGTGVALNDYSLVFETQLV